MSTSLFFPCPDSLEWATNLDIFQRNFNNPPRRSPSRLAWKRRTKSIQSTQL